ncbi:STE3-domain-containing protein [Trametes versicolor FP-101664 SS1]|uniref:STE3-domain-containing protein n=1 Tax=Trametes versicolor (strain FP-101664) TaxID=717944 RepID=UPI0004622260|nr:STE3-domain-containing protein [Trametes versicolor FP-101664 SS1]EIW56751.1 STE3-domain-containing protein [Trametes versicolor FP-101664 SS1]
MSVPWPVQVDIVAAFSLLGFVLVCIPLYWHLEAWNVGCVMYIFWIGTQSLFQFINAVVWRDNAINWAPAWCDITTHFSIGTSIAVCCASLVINRRLYHIANITAVSMTQADKRRNIITDLLIGMGIPVLSIALYWFYQGHRFDILEGVGCVEEYPNSFLAYLLFITWPIPIGLVSGTYCILTLRAFFRRRRDFSALIASNSNLTFNRYFRLMGLAAIEVLCTVPLATYNLVADATQPIYPYVGMADLHFGFSRVNQKSAVSWRADPAVVSAMDFKRWNVIACALVFFCFFGLAEEARKHYRLALSSVAKRVGITTLGGSSGFTATGSRGGASKGMGGSSFGRVTIPTFVQRHTRARASMDSFSDGLSTNISIGGDLGIDEKATYSPVESAAEGSSVNGSSTFLGSPISEKQVSPLETLPPVSFPPAPKRVYDPESPTRRETEPDVPASVRPHSIDMV